MNLEKLANDDLFQTDFAREDRLQFLRKIPSQKRPRNCMLAPGLPAIGIWGQDVSAMDRRSVKAYLGGRGDCRVMWWRLNQAFHQITVPQSTLEDQMFSFHSRHHRLTIAWWITLRNFWDMQRIFHAKGVKAMVRHGLCLTGDWRNRKSGGLARQFFSRMRSAIACDQCRETINKRHDPDALKRKWILK